uniref:Uncharacterized protein n=1 Tax=Wuchereria bancrofti TaxID=6293 RepID=A0AAF5RTR9_WUCBA
MTIIVSFLIFYTSREAACLAPCITNHILLYRVIHPSFPFLKKNRKMEDQLERENSQVFDVEDGGGSSSTKTNSATLECLSEILEHRESTIEDLRQTVATLKHNIAEQRDEIIRLKSLNSNTHKPQNSPISLPLELIKMIFYLCDALRRCHISVTNSPAVGIIRTTKAIPMLYNFRLVYTLSDFLTLPNLRMLYIRATLILADVLPVDKICTQIENLRICIHRVRIRQLLIICRALATTLRRLELLLTVIVLEGAATAENRSAVVIEVAETMTNVEHLSHLRLHKLFLNDNTHCCSNYPLLLIFRRFFFQFTFLTTSPHKHRNFHISVSHGNELFFSLSLHLLCSLFQFPLKFFVIYLSILSAINYELRKIHTNSMRIKNL